MSLTGTGVATWASQNQDGGGWGIYAQRLNETGSPIGSEFRVNTTTAGNQQHSAVAMNRTTGEFVVTWSSDAQDGNGWGVYAQRYNTAGIAQGGEFRVNTTTVSDQQFSHVAVDDAGNFVVTWSCNAQDGSGWGVYAQRYDASGVAQGGEFLANTTTAGNQQYSTVALNQATGDFVITWSSNGQDGNGLGVYAQRYDAAGLAQGSEFRVNTTTTNDQTSPAVAMDPTGNFVITWSSNGQDGNGMGVYAQRYNAGGGALGGEFRVNSTSTSDQLDASVTMSTAGSFVISWDSRQSGNWDVYAREYDSAGTAVGTEFRVNTTTTGDQQFASLAASATDFTVVWSSLNQDGASYGVFGQRYNAWGPPTVTLPAGPVSYTLGNPLTLIDATATIFDPDSPDFDTGTLTVGIIANGSADDRLEIQDGNNIRLSGNVVEWKSGGPNVPIGTFAGGTGATPLVVTLNANATPARTQDLLRAIGYRSVSSTAPSHSVTVHVVLSDGDGSTSTAQTETINIIGVNQGPVNGVPGPQATTINTPLTFSAADGNLISTSDPDAGTSPVSVTLTATNGTVTLNAGGFVTPVGNELLTNATTTNTQSEPAIARAANGNYVVVWSGYRNASNPDEIVFQLYDANGNLIGSQTIANSTTTNIQSQPDVAMDQNGNFVIVWVSNGQDPDGSAGVYGQRFDASGAMLGGEFRVPTVTVLGQTTPSVAMAANGDFVVVWQDDNDGDKEGIFGQRFNAAGVKQGGQFLVNDITLDEQSDPRVAMDANGNFVVTWTDKVNDGDADGVYARRFQANGTPLANQFLVSTRTDKAQEDSDIAMDAGGNFVIVWASKHKTGISHSVYGQLFDAAGNRVGPTEFQINTSESSTRQSPSVTMDTAGNFAVAWESVNQDNPGDLLKGVYLQQFDKNGIAIGPERLVNTTVVGAQDKPDIAMDADGDIVVAWHGNGGGDTSGVFQRRFNNATELAFSTGDGASDTTMTFTGSLTDLNSAMNGMVFTPDFNFTGLATVTITTNDLGNTGSGGAKSDSDVVNITVGSNTPPTITSNGGGAAANVSVLENTTAVTTVTATDPNAPPQVLTYSIVGGADVAKFTINNASGVLTFVSAPDFESPTDAGGNNVYNVTVQVNDGAGGLATQSLNVTVTNANDAPFAANNAYAVNEDSSLNVAAAGVLANDTDPEGGPLTAVLLTSTSNGVLLLNADGSFTYTPNANFSGSDSFTYRASDGSLGSNLATVTITVNPVNDVPVAANDSFSTTTAVPLLISAPGVLGNDSDAENDPLTASVVAGPTNGTVVLNANGSFLYTPNLLFVGSDSFTYEANDGAGNSNIATVSINVFLTNSPPNALNDAYSVNEDTPLNVTASGVLSNDSDPDGDPLVTVLVSGATNGSLVLNPNGSFTYTPNPNFSGLDSFTYQASDGVFLSPVATVTLTVAPINDAPVAGNDAYSINENTTLNVIAAGVLTNDSDVDGNPLSAVLVSGPSNGAVVLNVDGSFTYTPNANFSGIDSFSYRANDGAANSNLATVAVAVNPVNERPVAVNDLYTVTEDSVLIIPAPGVLANDSDPDGDGLVVVLSTRPANGTVVLSPNGAFVYTPNPDFTGVDSFTYFATDGFLVSADATVTIVVNPTNDPPVALGDSYSVNENNVLTVGPRGVLLNDRDPDDDPLSAILAAGPSNGLLVLNANGSFTYTPNANFTGTDAFSYRANDGTVDSNVVTVSITVNSINAAPVAVDDSYTVFKNQTLTAAIPGVLGNDSDVEGSPLTAMLVSATNNGSLLLHSDGSFVYSPDINFYGTDSFTYHAFDGLAFSSAAVVTINVQNWGIRITPGTTLVTTEAGGAATFSVVLESTPLAQVIIAVASSNAAEGTVSVSSLTFTPLDWNVSQTVTVTGVNEFIDDGDTGYTIVTTAVQSSDPLYNGVDADDVAVVNRNDDVAGFVVSPTMGLVTTRTGGTSSFQVQLTSQPRADVTLSLAVSDPGAVSISTEQLTFTPANWNTPQTVTVTGHADSLRSGNAPFTIVTGIASSADGKYRGQNPADVHGTHAFAPPPATALPPVTIVPPGTPPPPSAPLPAVYQPDATAIPRISSSANDELVDPILDLSASAANSRPTAPDTGVGLQKPVGETGVLFAAYSPLANARTDVTVFVPDEAEHYRLDPVVVGHLPPVSAGQSPAATTIDPPESFWSAVDDFFGRGFESASASPGANLAVATGLASTAGYLLVNTRMGLWLLSMLAAKPLWKRFDPVEVLYAWERDARNVPVDGEDDETLVSIVK